MTSFINNFLKNIKTLKQERDKLDGRKNTPIMVSMKLFKEEENKLNIFNKKLEPFLKKSINKIV